MKDAAPLDTAKEWWKWTLATLAVIALLITAPIWGVPFLLWKLFGPMIVDMKAVIEGRMKFW